MNNLYSEEPIKVHILPDDILHDGEHLIPLDDEEFRQLAFTSLIDGVNQTQPNILKEHKQTGESFGYVEELFEDEGGLYASLRLRKDQEELFRKGAFRFVSPSIAWNFTADDGKTRPAHLIEISFVDTPRHSLRQVPITELNKEILSSMSIFSSVGNESIRISQMSYKLTNNMEIPEMNLEELKEILRPLIEEVLGQLLPKEEVVEKEVEMAEEAESEDESEEVVAEDEVEMAEEEVVVEEKEEDESLESKLAAALTRLAELEAKLEDKEVEEEVSSDLKDKPHLSVMKQDLISMRKRDATEYKNFFSKMDKVLEASRSNTKSTMSQRLTANVVPARQVKDVYEYALELQEKEKLSWKDALTKAKSFGK